MAAVETPKKKIVPLYDIHVALTEDTYRGMTSGQFSEKVLAGLHQGFGLPREVLRQGFRDLLRDMITQHFPKMRCSVARGLFESRCPDLPEIVGSMPPSARRQFDNMLCAMDALETIMAIHMEEQVAERAKAFSRTARKNNTPAKS